MSVSAAEKTLFRDNLCKFLDNEVEPDYEQWEDDGIWPRELWNKLGENGFLCVDMPSEYGGYDAPFEMSCVVVEEMARAGYAALASAVSVHSDIVSRYILNLGNEHQKSRWLPGMVSGEVVGAIGMTEPAAGSDLQGMKTSAKKDGDEFVINGQKTFITNGQHSDVIVLAAKSDPSLGAKGITLFTVDCTLPGYEKGTNLKKMGLHSADTSEIFLSDVRVSTEEILGGEGRGFANLMNELRRERMICAVASVGAAEGMLAWTIDYTTERKAFGEPISKFQNTRFELAEIKTQIELNKALVEKYADKFMRDELTAEEASIAKLASSEMQGQVADKCVQLFGGYGYMKEYKISRAYTDARIQRIYAGTSEIMKELISRSLVGR